MALPATLITNEVKNASGTEVEFLPLDNPTPRSKRFKYSLEAPHLEYRLTISHSETGAGLKRRRRSLVRFDKQSISGVDDITPVTTSAYVVLDAPVGAIEDTTEIKAVLANLMSFMASIGASTTILYDCTGYGAAALVDGAL